MTTKCEIPQLPIIAGRIFSMLGVKKNSVTDIVFVLVTLHPPSIHFVSKMIYMYNVFLSLLTHLFESSSFAIYIPH